MLEIQMWQWIVVAVVAAACLVWMGRAIVGIFARTAPSGAASHRRATALESATLGADAPAGVSAFDVWSYRVPARFAGKTRIIVGDDAVVVAGPRVPFALYRGWIWLQGVLLALVPALAVWALLAWDWRLVVAALATFVVSFAISAGGAGLWPGLGELEYVTHGTYMAVEFPRSSVSDVAIGEGWSRGGMDVVLLPYKKGVDKMAEGGAVSFFAPDERGGEVRYALHCVRAEDAEELATLLKST